MKARPAQQPEQAQRALSALPAVLSVAQIGNSLRVLVRDGGDAGASLREALRQAGLRGEVTASTPNLEDVFVASMNTTRTGVDHYPGDAVTVEAWPGVAPGGRGVLNTMAPTVCDLSGVVDLEVKPPVLWIHGRLDPIVSDSSFYDYNNLGKLGIVPDWPGDEIAPPQEMVSQTRDVLARYADGGGEVVELDLEDVGHTPHLERPAEFRHALLEVIGYVGHPSNPAPPTEAIILRSSD